MTAYDSKTKSTELYIEDHRTSFYGFLPVSSNDPWSVGDRDFQRDSSRLSRISLFRLADCRCRVRDLDACFLPTNLDEGNRDQDHNDRVDNDDARADESEDRLERSVGKPPQRIQKTAHTLNGILHTHEKREHSPEEMLELPVLDANDQEEEAVRLALHVSEPSQPVEHESHDGVADEARDSSSNVPRQHIGNDVEGMGDDENPHRGDQVLLEDCRVFGWFPNTRLHGDRQEVLKRCEEFLDDGDVEDFDLTRHGR